MKFYPHTFSGLPAVQVESELNGFLALLKEKKVRSYLEIGTARGDTFYTVMSSLPRSSVGVAVDMPEASWGLDKSKTYLDYAIAGLDDDYLVQAIYGSSRDKEIIDKVSVLAPFDMVFIDGDHTLEGVTKDYENYGHLGKMVAFHDIVDDMRANKRGETIDVPVFWKKLKNEKPYIEFVEQGSKMGIGVIFNK